MKDDGRIRIVNISLLYDLDCLFDRLFTDENMTAPNKREVMFLQKEVGRIIEG